MSEPERSQAPEPSTDLPAEDSRVVAGNTLRRMRRKNLRQILLRLLIVSVLPTTLVAAYLGLWATPQYESEAVFAVDSPDGSAVLNPIPGTHVPRDVRLAQQYALSRNMLRQLLERHRFAEHFRQGHIDYLSRLSGDASFEATYAYYREHVDVTFDPQSSFVTVRVRAFSGRAAHRFTAAILDNTEEMIRRESTRIRNERIEAAEQGADTAIERLTGVRRDIAALERQLRPTAPDTEPANASELEGNLARARVREELAMRTFQVALDSLEAERTAATQQHRYVVRATEPSRPDVATYPKVLRTTFTVFLASFGLLVIGSLILAAVREHAQF
jgi:capsular polysaccharide transport system permease protein